MSSPTAAPLTSHPRCSPGAPWVAARFRSEVRTNSELIEVDPDSRRAVIVDYGSDTKEVIGYDLMHVVPPQSAPDWLKATTLADPANAAGYVEIDKNSMRHTRYDTVFSLGDAGSSPNSRTGPPSASRPPS